ncbi:MAG: HEAT repeat domain-containing protein, partial [Planctomycetota bacterium]
SALSGCGDDEALETLLKMIHDKDPDVAAVAVKGCGSFPKVKVERRKKALRQLIDRYKKVTDEAAGKDSESPQLKMYKKVKPAIDATLQAMSGGERLDSALAWDAWLRERMKQPWPE